MTIQLTAPDTGRERAHGNDGAVADPIWFADLPDGGKVTREWLLGAFDVLVKERVRRMPDGELSWARTLAERADVDLAPVFANKKANRRPFVAPSIPRWREDAERQVIALVLGHAEGWDAPKLTHALAVVTGFETFVKPDRA